MIQKSYFPFVLIGVVLLLALSACGSPATPAPTLDMNAVFTQVGATLEMGYTQTALAMPTATNTPEPTLTPEPSATPQPLIITTPTATITPTFAGLASMYTNPATANGCYNGALVQDVKMRTVSIEGRRKSRARKDCSPVFGYKGARPLGKAILVT